ncbi:hypothetical protein MPTK2_1g20050 [Marchantia polymorpha subsp. ruderalis]
MTVSCQILRDCAPPTLVLCPLPSQTSHSSYSGPSLASPLPFSSRLPVLLYAYGYYCVYHLLQCCSCIHKMRHLSLPKVPPPPPLNHKPVNR